MTTLVRGESKGYGSIYIGQAGAIFHVTLSPIFVPGETPIFLEFDSFTDAVSEVFGAYGAEDFTYSFVHPDFSLAFINEMRQFI